MDKIYYTLLATLVALQSQFRSFIEDRPGLITVCPVTHLHFLMKDTQVKTLFCFDFRTRMNLKNHGQDWHTTS